MYCDFPGEETSARAALRMIEQGFHEVHVLSGGWQAWSSKGYATQPVSEEETA
ncbi:MAG: rhodanese-like domain-containing protein [bacterium]